jgi:putative SOS response-associated peptidase YedK
MTLTRRELIELADELEAACDSAACAAHRPRYNVAPTDQHPVLRLVGGARQLALAGWGLPPAVKGRGPLINVRSETARFSRKALMASGRCVVPADGFYEWKSTPEGRAPMWFHRADGKLLLLAGLWEAGRFTVLTTTANPTVAGVHDRMPVILTPDDAQAWLLAPTERLLRPAPEGLLAVRAVSARVNSVRNDDPACLEPPAPAAQLSLL